ncbi:uncharacterized protein F5891DRAFT_1182151 [Suillus fuscotomentosus]|uniref:Uncharacterized protein n=1 Tax=Suillus fuscotomentosus TaxID=1912939 RepID=A0AAD4EKM5_9AGAM|nr:uncharacterized protein F5891DRAFT_1182151 [Suillus fuscotomentosus]KAG1906739.1 hypothetical protein F5891DRAFT_1182151 [Suillus fuscotomentosus]
MNTSINTLKWVQRMHANFAALNLNAEEGGMGDEPPDIGEEGMVDKVIEIILHTLFESGVTRIQDLERYIKDNVVRHELRLVDLEKKLVGAYRETVKTQVEILNDDALFAGEDDESYGSLALLPNWGHRVSLSQRSYSGKLRGAAGATIDKTQRTTTAISTTASLTSYHEQECGRPDWVIASIALDLPTASQITAFSNWTLPCGTHTLMLGLPALCFCYI